MMTLGARPWRVPEQELFGPLSMRALEEDRYVRQVDGYLPSARVAFIDEIFKANSAILNTLLTILNERLFDNGSSRVRVPLVCLVSFVQPPSCLYMSLMRPSSPTAHRQRWSCKLAAEQRSVFPVCGQLCLARHTSCNSNATAPYTCRWALPTSCQRARSWTRSMTAS